MDDGNAPPTRSTPTPRRGSRPGSLPSDEEMRRSSRAGYERFRHLDEGNVADYIPALAKASPDAFGVCVVGVHGRVFAIGDAEQEFTIQSISKLFVFALVCDTLGPAEARRKLGVNSTGLPFDSVMGIELNEDRTMNPMVNAGALATTSLVPGGFARGEVRAHRRRALGVRRTVTDRGRGGVRVRGGDQRPQPRHRPSPERLRAPVLRSRCRHRHLHAAVLAARVGARPGRHGGDAGRRRGQPADRRVGPLRRGPAGGSCRSSPPPVSTSARGTGSTTWACRARAGSAGGW